MELDWDVDKDKWLRKERKIGFKRVLEAIEKGRVLGVIDHPNKRRYPRQKAYVLEINGYAYFVPFVDNGKRFLKTIIPSRKLTKKYLEGR